MKNFLSSLIFSLGLVTPVLVACSGATADPAPGADPTSTDGEGSAASVDADIKSGKKKACASVGGTCVGLSPSSCGGGHFADASKVSCGPGVGVACCVSCPALTPPAPGFCAGGTIVGHKDANGCATAPECVLPPSTCPELTPLPPGFCPPDRKIVPVKNKTTGCTVGFECSPAPSPTTCEAAGGACVGLTPGSCPAGTWGDASKYTCGGGLGVGCCLP
jgi:hypothetical protein